MYLLGYDIGSSSIKAALVNIESSETSFVAQSPEREMDIHSPSPGWAEQHPDTWWQHVCTATKKLLEMSGAAPADIKGIGIAYQMHGLVLVDKDHEALRPSIIWCDSRAVEVGKRAFDEIGQEHCLSHLLNSPGNFTAAKLAWVKENEPSIFEKTHKFMLPGDYIAMKLTGEIMITASGLSEGIFWDFKENGVANSVMRYFGFDEKLIPDIASTFAQQGKMSKAAAAATGLAEGTPVTYRAGDQPNNALSLNALEPGEVAATGGTSGVVYGIVDQPKYDPQSRVNSFLHVNHRLTAHGRWLTANSGQPTFGLEPSTVSREPSAVSRIGILLCINGAGSQYAWVKKNVAESGASYLDMERAAAALPPGTDGLRILPFGNGAERMLGNGDIGARVLGLQFNRHGRAHLYRAALEGIAFSFVYGMGILKEMGLNVRAIRVGNDNLFQSAVFSNTISTLVGSRIEVYQTTGAVGAAKAAGVATGFYSSVNEAMQGGKVLMAYEPVGEGQAALEEAYRGWKEDLKVALASGR